jgi:hypothetical protein
MLAIVGAVLVGCQAPVQVPPQPDIAAVRKQNVVTKTHIGKTRTEQDDAVKHLRNVETDLDELLKE